MPRHLCAAIVALVLAALLPPLSGARSQTGRPQSTDGVQELWREYPLEQTTTAETPRRQPASRPDPAPIQAQRGVRSHSEDKGGSTLDLTALIGLGVAGATAIVVFLVMRTRRRVDAGNYTFRRPREIAAARPPDFDQRVAAYAALAVPTESSAEAHPSRRSVSVTDPWQPNTESEHDDRVEKIESESSVAPPEPSRSTDYRQVGEHVTTVLTTAERAAADIREAAARDAEQLRFDAEKRVAEATAEAETIRAEADAYREETHAAADSYAKEARDAADADALKVSAAAEQRAKGIEAAARQNADDIVTEALRRRDALQESATDLEARIAQLLSRFKAITGELEALVPTDREARLGEPRDDADVVVDDTLEDALKPERAA